MSRKKIEQDVDIGTAAALLREQLRLPRWAASVSVAEVNGHEAIVICVEQRQAQTLHGMPMPQSFEGYPVFVEIRPIGVAH
jgi:hypothetical protein